MIVSSGQEGITLAQNHQPDAIILQNLGVVDVITKPFNSMTLASQIAKILGCKL